MLSGHALLNQGNCAFQIARCKSTIGKIMLQLFWWTRRFPLQVQLNTSKSENNRQRVSFLVKIYTSIKKHLSWVLKK